MRFSQEFINKVQEASSIVEIISERGIVLKSTGSSNYKGLCPFHHEKTGSFSVNAQKGFYYCFGCHASGNTIKFLMNYDRLSFVDSVTELANRYAIPLETISNDHHYNRSEQNSILDKLKSILKKTSEYYQNELKTSDGKGTLSYLENRGITQNFIERFGLGYAPRKNSPLKKHFNQADIADDVLLKSGIIKKSSNNDTLHDQMYNRLTFPIKDIRGDVVAFGGRAVEEGQMPKYLNSPETAVYQKNKILYGLYEALPTIKQKKRLIITEGYMDVIAMHQAGISESVAACGTALTKAHVDLIKKYTLNVVLLFDSDNAGQKAALKSAELFLATPIIVTVALLPEGEDPDSFLKNHSKDHFNELIGNALPLLEYVVNKSLDNFSASVQGRKQALEYLLPIINKIPDIQLRQLTLNDVADQLKLPVGPLLAEVSKIKSYDKINQAKLQDRGQNSVQNNANYIYNADQSRGITQNDQNLNDNGPYEHNIDNGVASPHETFILQILLADLSLVLGAKEKLKLSDFRNVAARNLYQSLSRLSGDELSEMNSDELAWLFPELKNYINQLSVNDVLPSDFHTAKNLDNYINRLLTQNQKIRVNELKYSRMDDMEMLKQSKNQRQHQLVSGNSEALDNNKTNS